MLVSITTATYNSEKTIARTIESVLNQSYKDIEYIIMDGASTDATIEIANSYKQRFEEKGYRYYIFSEKDNGMYDALNKSIQKCSGELIGNVNSDDWYESNAVEEMVRFYEQEKYDLAWSDLRIHSGNNIIIKKAKVGKIWLTSGFCHPTMFGTREIMRAYPYACRALDDDFDMVTRVKADGKCIKTLPKILSNYTIGGMSTEKSLKKMFSRIKMKYDTYRRNGFSRLYWFYCVAMECAKYILGGN